VNIESTAVDIIARVAPWGAPLPTAYLVGQAVYNRLKWPIWVAVSAGITIESLGLATTATALMLWNYDRSKRKTDPSAPLALSLALVGVYFIAVISLTVLLDTAPRLAVYAPVVFPLLSFAGTAVIAIRADHRRRLADIEAARQQRRRERAENAQKRRERAEARQNLRNIGQTARQILRIVAADQTQTQSEIAQAAGVTRQTVAHHLARLEQIGLIARRDGQIEVCVDPAEVEVGVE